LLAKVIDYQAEYVQMVRDALMAFATGVTAPEASDYGEFRRTLLSDPAFKDLAPAFFRTCRTLGDFWDFMKSQGQYATRRKFIRDEFEPLLSKLEGNEPSASSKAVASPVPQAAKADREDPEISDRRRVFVVHGRNELARDAMFALLRAIGLDPLEWSEAVRATGKPNPGVLEVVETGMRLAHAVVVLMTGDDEARLLPQFITSRDSKEEVGPTPQARPNVLFEAGMALALWRDRTVLVSLGSLRPLSDLSGLHLVHMDDSTQRRQDLAERLQSAGCPVNLGGRDWHKVGQFGDAVGFAERPAARTAPAAQMDTQAVTDRWREILERMNRTIRAAFLDADVAFDGSTLTLTFHYGFHLMKAKQQIDTLQKLVSETFGPRTSIVMEQRERGPSRIVTK
jgi:predicted nucleotide-binding protein